jgi:hypothetical protein
MKKFLILTSLALIVSSSFASPGSSTQDVPNLDHARFNTEVAENYLRTPKTDLGGHRGKALAALATATQEINAAILFAKEHPGQ